MSSVLTILDVGSELSRRIALLLVIFCCSGATCSRSMYNPFAAVQPPAPEVLTPGATLDQVIHAVNQNSSRIQNYQTSNATITVPGMSSLPLLRGNIAAQRPNRIRLQATTALTGPEVDLGSNDELFWFWVKRNNPPALYFSRHDQFVGSAAQQVMPIEPQWLLDALGFAQFSPSDFHEGPIPHDDGTIEIRSVLESRLGKLTKSTVIDSRKALVLEQHIYDSQGNLLASSRAKSHRYYPMMNISLPHEIELHLPAAQLSLSIDVGSVQLNQQTINSSLWQMPDMSGYPQIDLGTAPPGGISNMQSVGSSDWGTLASPSFVGIRPEIAGAGQASYNQEPNLPSSSTASRQDDLQSTSQLARQPDYSHTPQRNSSQSTIPPQSFPPRDQHLPVGGREVKLRELK